MAIRRKVFALDEALVQALKALSQETGKPLDALADEAFRQYLKKLKRPATLDEALRASLRREPANDPEPGPTRRRRS